MVGVRWAKIFFSFITKCKDQIAISCFSRGLIKKFQENYWSDHVKKPEVENSVDGNIGRMFLVRNLMNFIHRKMQIKFSNAEVSWSEEECTSKEG